MSVRRLLLLRHAKSDWGTGLPDHERPLAPRGRRDAPRVGAWLASVGAAPDRILSSSSRRTRETVALASEGGRWQAETSFDDRLYGASADELARRLATVPARFERPMLVGHQPGMGEFVARAIGEARVRFPTAAVAALRVPAGSWSDWGWGELELEWLMTPKGLPLFD